MDLVQVAEVQQHDGKVPDCDRVKLSRRGRKVLRDLAAAIGVVLPNRRRRGVQTLSSPTSEPAGRADEARSEVPPKVPSGRAARRRGVQCQGQRSLFEALA